MEYRRWKGKKEEAEREEEREEGKTIAITGNSRGSPVVFCPSLSLCLSASLSLYFISISLSCLWL
jgi:hypothetical protein